MPRKSLNLRIPLMVCSLLLAALVAVAAIPGEAFETLPASRLAKSTPPPSSTSEAIVFSDSFNRPNSDTIGNAWVENEVRGARSAVDGQRLCFLETSDKAVSPQVLHRFKGNPSSFVEWKFQFDWARTGPGSDYQLFMQLGDADLMIASDVRQGVAVNLVWSAVDGAHEMLGYYDATSVSPLSVLSGQATLVVVTNPMSHTYEVFVDQTSAGSGIPYDQEVAVNSIRILTSELDDANFHGRCFDSLVISLRERDDTGRATSTPVTPTLVSTSTPTPSPTSTATSPGTLTGTPLTTPTPTPLSTATPTWGPTSTAAPGSYPQWSRVELVLLGPASVGMSNAPNPFAITADVTFTGPDGTTYVAPAFYDGDGSGAMDGSVWKVRFSPSAPGSWSYRSESSEPLLDGQGGTFQVIAPSGCAAYQPGDLPDFGCLGRLASTGSHYLQFSAGLYWLKGGVDDPEDFLAQGNTVGFPSREAAIDFLASQGVNSLYMLLHNVDGDARSVWPWVGATEAEARANHEHFALAKLEEWEALFSYLQSKGVVLHLVLEDDSAWTGFNRGMYYREMVARFGHHPGLIWNLAEEYNETYSASQIQTFAGLLRALDPYDHPITVHNAGGLSAWTPFVGHPNFDLTSFQTGDQPQNAAAVSWFSTMENASRTIPISFDETGKLGADDRDLARHIAWSVYLGGANFELHTSPLSSYQDFALHFEDLTRARAYLEGLPFCEMAPMNGRVLSGSAYAAGRPEDLLVAYLPVGGSIQLDLRPASGLLHVTWFDPGTGNTSALFSISGGTLQTFTSPFPGDSVLTIVGDGADMSTCR